MTADPDVSRALGDLARAALDAADEGLDLSTAGERIAPYFRVLAAMENGRPGVEAEEAYATLAELQARPELLQPPECVVPRIAYRGRGVAVCAPDKAGKSTLLSHALAALTRGRRFLDGETSARTGRAVWTGLEEALADGVRRLTELDADPERVHLVTLAPPDLLTRTDAVLASVDADLWVVDSLTEWARVTCGTVPDDGDNAGWAAVVRPMVATARQRDVALVILHHVRRSDGQFRGAGEIAASVDALLEFVPAERGDDPSMRRIKGRGRWPVEPFRVALRDGRYELDGGVTLSTDALILIQVEQHPGCSLRDVCQAVPGRTEKISRTITELISRGAIEDRGAGGRMALYPLPREAE